VLKPADPIGQLRRVHESAAGEMHRLYGRQRKRCIALALMHPTNWLAAAGNRSRGDGVQLVSQDRRPGDNGSKANPCLSADILGDWRKELIARTADGKELRIYTTTIPTEHRLVTPMHDRQYRLSIAWQNVAYNQPPHTSFYLGVGMTPPPRSNIVTVKPSQQPKQ